MEGALIVQPILDIDREAGAAYLQLSDAAVRQTCEVAPGVYVDLDEFDVVRGVEILNLSVEIPRSVLVERFHVRPADLMALDALPPLSGSVQGRPTTRAVGHDSRPARTRATA